MLCSKFPAIQSKAVLKDKARVTRKVNRTLQRKAL